MLETNAGIVVVATVISAYIAYRGAIEPNIVRMEAEALAKVSESLNKELQEHLHEILGIHNKYLYKHKAFKHTGLMVKLSPDELYEIINDLNELSRKGLLLKVLANIDVALVTIRSKRILSELVAVRFIVRNAVRDLEVCVEGYTGMLSIPLSDLGTDSQKIDVDLWDIFNQRVKGYKYRLLPDEFMNVCTIENSAIFSNLPQPYDTLFGAYGDEKEALDMNTVKAAFNEYALIPDSASLLRYAKLRLFWRRYQFFIGAFLVIVLILVQNRQ